MRAIIYSFDAYISVVISIIAVIILVNYYSVEANYVDYYQTKLLSLDVMRVLIESGAATSLNEIEMRNILSTIPEKYYYKLTYEDRGVVKTITSPSLNYKKLKVVTKMLIPVIDRSPLISNPYSYLTCGGTQNACSSSTKKSRVYDSVYFSTFTLEVGV